MRRAIQLRMTTTANTINEKAEPMALPLTYYENQCYINSFINKKHHYKNKNLKLVIGSLGLNGWFEFGGKDWGMEEFKKKMGAESSDSHCWLEDDNGNIYDYVFKGYDDIAEYRTGRKLGYTGILEGKSKKWCKSAGLTYLPASKEVQTMLFLNVLKILQNAESKLASGRAKWFLVPGTEKGILAGVPKASTLLNIGLAMCACLVLQYFKTA